MAQFLTAPKPPPERSVDGIRAVGRALLLLQLMARSEREAWALNDLSRLSGLAKSTTHRLLETMIAAGFVERGVEVGIYRLGLQAAVVGSAAARLRRPDDMVQATLHAVRSRTGESVGLAVLSGDHSVTVARALSREPLRFNFEIGGVFPVHASAGGKVLLSSFSDDEVRLRFGHRKLLTRYTERTITHVDRLIEHLAEVREQGYAIDDEEASEGQRCICVPVRIGDRPARHALGVAAPSVRADIPRLLRVVGVLHAGAAELSAALAMDVYS